MFVLLTVWAVAIVCQRLIYGLVTGMSMPDAVEFGVAASALKHTIPGDLNHATLSDVKELMKVMAAEGCRDSLWLIVCCF